MVSMQQLTPRPSPMRPAFHDRAGSERAARPRGASLEDASEVRASERVRVLLIESDAETEAMLQQALERAGASGGVRRVSRAELGAPANGDSRAGNARALLVEALEEPARASAALAAIRSDAELRALPALVAIDPSRGDWLEHAGAFDDFLLYPWSPEELLGRIRVLQHRQKSAQDQVLRIGPVSVDEGTRTASVAGGRVQLTVREFALLSYLGTRRGRVLSREHLLSQVWGATYRGGRRTVDVHIRRLRAKLGAALRIETVRSGGYKLCPDPA